MRLAYKVITRIIIVSLGAGYGRPNKDNNGSEGAELGTK